MISEEKLWQIVQNLPDNPAAAIHRLCVDRLADRVDPRSFDAAALLTIDMVWRRQPIPEHVLQWESECEKTAAGMSFIRWLAESILDQMGNGWCLIYDEGMVVLRCVGETYGDGFTVEDNDAQYQAGEIYWIGGEPFACTQWSLGEASLMPTNPPDFLDKWKELTRRQ